MRGSLVFGPLGDLVVYFLRIQLIFLTKFADIMLLLVFFVVLSRTLSHTPKLPTLFHDDVDDS